MNTNVPRWLSVLILTAVAFVAMLTLHVTGSAQTDQGRIVGTVTDANGAIVPGASIVIKNDRTGDERTTTTNDAGYYAIFALRPSSYSVTATAQNLTVRLTNVQLLVGQELSPAFEWTSALAALSASARFSQQWFRNVWRYPVFRARG